MANRYALSDYILNITLPNNQAILSRCGFDENNLSFSIGGPGLIGSNIGFGYGSFIGEIEVSRSNKLWSTSGDATGSWVHNKNLDRTGSVRVSINQISDQILLLVQICNAYELVQDAVGGFKITITDASNSNNIIATAHDCYIEQIPSIKFGDTAANRDFVFTSGSIIFES